MHPFINSGRGFGFKPQHSGHTSVAGKEGKATVFSGAPAPSCICLGLLQDCQSYPQPNGKRKEPCCPQKSNQGMTGSIAPFHATAWSWSALLETRDSSSSPTSIWNSRWGRGWDVSIWEYFSISCKISWNKEWHTRQEQESGSLEEGETVTGLVLSCMTEKWLLTFACVSLPESYVERFRAAWVACDILTVAWNSSKYWLFQRRFDGERLYLGPEYLH